MALEILSDLRAIHWQPLVIPLVGLSSVGLTLMMGRLLFRMRRSQTPSTESQSKVDPFESGSAAERRSSPRRAGREIKVLVSDSQALAEPEPGFVVNRSLGGLRLSLAREVPEHSILSVRPADAQFDCPWLQVQVKHSVQMKDGNWEVGCEFVKTPPWAVLLQFS
jgi:hypothetical protein